jgi:hypothetical protein
MFSVNDAWASTSSAAAAAALAARRNLAERIAACR